MSERFPGIDWFCDRCNACLNDQDGFNDWTIVNKVDRKIKKAIQIGQEPKGY